MYREITTETELGFFNRFWDKICIEKGYGKTKASLTHSKKYVFYDNNIVNFDIEKHEILGIVEITLHNQEYSTVQDDFDFSQYEEIVSKKSNTYEIDKLAVSSNYRGTGILDEIIALIASHSLETNAYQYIMLIEYGFFRALKWNYQIPLVELLKIKNPLPNQAKGIRDGKSLLIPSLLQVQNEDGGIENWLFKVIKTIRQKELKKRDMLKL